MKILREVQPGVWNYRPYEARIQLKSIRYWKSVISGKNPAKRPMAYYTNKMIWWDAQHIATLNKIAGDTEIKEGDEFLYLGSVEKCSAIEDGAIWYDGIEDTPMRAEIDLCEKV